MKGRILQSAEKVLNESISEGRSVKPVMVKEVLRTAKTLEDQHLQTMHAEDFQFEKIATQEKNTHDLAKIGTCKVQYSGECYHMQYNTSLYDKFCKQFVTPSQDEQIDFLQNSQQRRNFKYTDRGMGNMKLHLGVDPRNVEEAWNIVSKHMLKDDVVLYFIIAYPHAANHKN
mgnify:CR=1 FL=1